MGKTLNLFQNRNSKKIIDNDCIYCKVGGTCNECKLKTNCNSYLSKK